MKNSEPRYYKPDIEEFHVGFECERRYPSYISADSVEYYDWEQITLSEKEPFPTADEYDPQFRVKHLDMQDIINLGFTLLDDHDDVGQATFGKDEWFLVWTRDIVEIHRNDDLLFCGKVKNKSELKILLKQVGYEMDNSEMAS